MPYIITTSEPFNAAVHVHRPAFTRTAVATLDEARDHVHLLGAGYGVMAHLDCVLDGTSRMPVGPLPDGTVIEVRPATRIEVLDELGQNAYLEMTGETIA